MKYDTLSGAVSERIREDKRRHILSEFRAKEEDILRREDLAKDRATLLRPGFVRDCEKILHSNFYERYTDKTQVFSFYKNDDISRRGLHVQLVSRIARNIGNVLGLNTDLIEAISLGHDIGHTPFGHEGERILSDIRKARTGLCFDHNVHSVRLLDGVLHYNISLQTLDGILCHNGEMEQKEYHPSSLGSFEALDRTVEACQRDHMKNLALVPATLEGCVVRIADIIAYIGKDRQDAVRTGKVKNESDCAGLTIGTHNAEIINNLSVNIVENSYGKDHLAMDDEYFAALQIAKNENYERIYRPSDPAFRAVIRPMMEKMYDTLVSDIRKENLSSPVFTHHIDLIEKSPYRQDRSYRSEEADQIVVDYIAGMTDDYFLDLFGFLFPESDLNVPFKTYFQEARYGKDRK